MKMMKIKKLRVFALAVIISGSVGCREVTVPKPRGYFRIDLPEKKYVAFNDSTAKFGLPLVFEYPAYGVVSMSNDNSSEPGWFNIEFPSYKAKIYLTYKDVKGDLSDLIEQTYILNVKNHISKADAIDEQDINNPGSKVYGILYDLKGNTATSVQFYVTDSIKHYLRGSLYFASEPNADSLAPVIEFFRVDIIHLIETLKWKGK